MGGACSTHGKDKWIQNFDQKPEGKTPLARPKRRWEDNIRMDLREVGRDGGLNASVSG